MPDLRHMPDFLRPTALALALLLALPLSAAPALAAGDDVKFCLCTQVLSRMLCKKPSEFSNVGKLEENVFILSVFYASKDSQFLCAVSPDGQVIIQDRTWRPTRRVMPFTVDSDGKCASLTYSSPDCPTKAVAKCCPVKGPQDANDQIRETFWNRPIPKILEEEYKAMMAKDQPNATAPAPAETKTEGEK